VSPSVFIFDFFTSRLTPVVCAMVDIQTHDVCCHSNIYCPLASCLKLLLYERSHAASVTSSLFSYTDHCVAGVSEIPNCFCTLPPHNGVLASRGSRWATLRGSVSNDNL
jgi:hypothetical protein